MSTKSALDISKYTPKFNGISKQYIINKRKHIYPFYNQVLGDINPVVGKLNVIVCEYATPPAFSTCALTL